MHSSGSLNLHLLPESSYFFSFGLEEVVVGGGGGGDII